MTRVLSDQPIDSAEQDELDAAAFAKRLVRPLLDWAPGDCVVVGLYAPWGHGKSSVMNLLEEELGSAVEPVRAIPLRFNPWIYPDSNTLLHSFFGTLTRTVSLSSVLNPTEQKALTEAVRGFATYVVPVVSAIAATVVPGAREGGEALSQLMRGGEADLRKKKTKIWEAMKKLAKRTPPCRVVILMDDIDRVEDDELQSLLRLVKLVADMPNTTYVLAADHSRVREVVARGKSVDYGQAYLEKIVQLPVFLPPITPEIVQRLTKAAIATVLKDVSLPADLFSENAVPESLDFYSETLGKRVCTLRDRARLVNVLRLILLARSEGFNLSPLDAVLVAFLQTFYPDAYERVRRNREFLVGEESTADLVRRIADRPGAEEAIQASRKRTLTWIATGIRRNDDTSPEEAELSKHGLGLRDFEAIEATLRYLFPRALAGEATDSTSQLRLECRIQLPEYFDRYFLAPPDKHEISDALVESLVATLLSLGSDLDSGTAAFASVLEKVSPEKRDSFTAKLGDHIAQLPAQSCGSFAAIVVQLRSLLTGRELERMLTLLGSRLARAARRATGAEKDTFVSGKIQVLKMSVEQAPTAPDAILVADGYIKTKDLDLDKAEGEQLARLALARIDEYALGGSSVFRELGDFQGGKVIWRWRDLLRVVGEPFDSIGSYLKALIEADVSVLPSVLSLFGSWALGKEPVPGLGGMVPQDVLQSIETLFPTAFLQEAARKFAGMAEAVQENDRHGLVGQFLEMTADAGKRPTEQDSGAAASGT